MHWLIWQSHLVDAVRRYISVYPESFVRGGPNTTLSRPPLKAGLLAL